MEQLTSNFFHLGAGDANNTPASLPAFPSGTAAFIPPWKTTKDPASVTVALKGSQPTLSGCGMKVHAASPLSDMVKKSPPAREDGGCLEYNARTATAATKTGLSACGWLIVVSYREVGDKEGQEGWGTEDGRRGEWTKV